MYPFNRIRDFRARCNKTPRPDLVESSVVGFSNKNVEEDTETSSPETKNFIASVLELSTPDQRWTTTRCGSVTEEKTYGFYGLTRNIHSVANGLKPVLMILRIMGFFPQISVLSRRNPCRQNTGQFILFLLSLLIIAFNSHIYYNNVKISYLYHSRFGFLHTATVSHLISGIKPLVNAGLILLFIWRIKKHVKMIKMMDTLDLCFRSTFHQTPNTKLYTISFCIAFAISLIIPLSWRIFELYHQHGFLFDELFSVFVVPMLTAWNLLPLLYYVLCNSIIRFWCRVLRKSLKKEHIKRHFSLKFYYEQFLRITSLQECVGNTFNPFILFSLAWSLILLCLTIYFMTQPTSSLTEPITHEQQNNDTLRAMLNHRIFLNMGWSLIQIIVAILHICIISATGMRTNEETRKILSAVLAIVPDANADLDRFQISCFVHKMSTQYMWGMTVWRAFPLERTTFFTLVSVIITYSLLLLKLKENPHISPRVPSFHINNTG